MGFGTNLKNLRTAATLSQDDVARALNMTRPTYKQLETGAREPSNAELKAISELLGERVEGLLADDPVVDSDSGLRGNVVSGVDKLKYKNLILYLAQQIGAKPNVGETVFYKMIYFIETLSRVKTGKGIANESFYKRQYGPVPVSFQTITSEMINSNELDSVQGRYFTYKQTKYLPRIEAAGLTDDEINTIDTIIGKLGDKSATELSDLSHKDEPWIVAQDGEVVDLSLVNKTDSEWAVLMGRLPVQA